MRAYSIYENSGGDLKAVKTGFRWGAFLLTGFTPVPQFAWAAYVRFWWLVAIDAVCMALLAVMVVFGADASSPLAFFAISILMGLWILYLVAFFRAEDWEAKRFERLGYTLVDYVEGRSGEHALDLFSAQKYQREVSGGALRS